MPSSPQPSQKGLHSPQRHAAVEVCPITDADLPRVARFLGENFPPDTPPEQWANAWKDTVNLTGSNAPNHGFMLRVGEDVVGAYPTIYSTREIDGRPEHFCNLAVWFTAPKYRHHSVRMLHAILSQRGWHFTDLTPIEKVQQLDLRLGFKYLDTTTLLIPNLPWPSLPDRVTITSEPRRIDAALSSDARTYYRDHAGCRWARHLALVWDDQSCYIQWRRERRKRLPVFSSIRYVSNPTLFRKAYRPLARHLLLHFGAIATLAEVRVIGGRVRPSLELSKSPARMYKSDTLSPDNIDYLYSEITSAP